MTSRFLLPLLLAGLLSRSPAALGAEPSGAWAIDVQENLVSLAAEDASTREVVLALVELFGLRLVEHAPIEGLVSLTLHGESLHGALASLLERHSFQLYASIAAEAGAEPPRPAGTLWIFPGSAARAPAATASLEAVLYEGTRQEKLRAISVLRSQGHSASVAALSLALVDDDRRVRNEALAALENIGTPEATAAIASVTADFDPRVRDEGAEALASLGTDSSERYLTLALNDPNPHVRRSAIESLVDVPLGAVPNDRVVRALGRALGDADPEVRLRAVDALEEVGGSVAFGALLEAQHDDDARVAEAAKESLELLSH